MNIAIITNSFPFPPGEQFIEVEIRFWERSGFKKIYLLPSSAKDWPRAVPSNVILDCGLANHDDKLPHVLRALLSRFFYKEIMLLLHDNKLSLKTTYIALESTAAFLRAKHYLVAWLMNHSSIDIVYTYWNHDFTYAACVAKQEGLVRKVVSRAHRYDLYEDKMPERYMPLKKQFIGQIDRLYVLSPGAKEYVQSTYSVKSEQCEVSPLGVSMPGETSPPSDTECFHIVSVSFCTRVKRIDKIIKSIALFASGVKDSSAKLNIKWTHIGDGPLKRDIEELANQHLKSLDNVTWACVGHLSNENVRSFYLENHVDCFISASESEGIPVSIMEAMAAGVPAIAPDVGGVSELVSNDCGRLLTERAEIDEIARAISFMRSRARDVSFRNAAREKVARRFNAEKNYPDFIKRLEKLGTINGPTVGS